MTTVTVRTIITEEDYDAALNRIDQIFEAAPGTPEGEELHILTLLVNEYDEIHYKLQDPDPIEAIKIRMEDLGLKDKDLIPTIGDKATVSKILNKKRPLTLEMVRNLVKSLGLPPEVLIGGYAMIFFLMPTFYKLSSVIGAFFMGRVFAI